MDWLRAHETLSWWLFGLSLAGWVAGFIGVPLLLVRIPGDYFARERRPPLHNLTHRPLLRGLLLVLKNLLGAVSFLAGVVMLVTPGQGLLFIALGIWLMDIPGKYSLERWIIGHRRVLGPINRLRRRAGRPPLEAPQGVAEWGGEKLP